jgi:hypothetical protein
MNESDTNLDLAPETGIRALQEELQGLRTLVVSALLVLIVMAGSLNLFLWRQNRVLNVQVAEQQAAVDYYNRVNAPIAMELWRNLLEYAKKHPDFQQTVIEKYKPYLGVPNPAPVAAPAAGAPRK